MEENKTQDMKGVSEDPVENNRLEEGEAGDEIEDFKNLYEASFKTIEEGDTRNTSLLISVINRRVKFRSPNLGIMTEMWELR
jgi:hypothetical protein